MQPTILAGRQQRGGCPQRIAQRRTGLPVAAGGGFSGIAATALFFRATDLVRDNPAQLAAVEATQAGEVLFTLLGGILLLGDALPNLFGWIGILLVAGGIVLSSLCAATEKR